MSVPACTIVVPTFNRPLPLRDCLDAIARLTQPEGGFEVLVVDDGGAASLAFVEDYADTRLHRQPNAGPASARNAGAARGSGQWLAFLDDDCCPQPDWLVRMVAALQQQPDALAGGHTRNDLTGSMWSEASQQLTQIVQDWENGSNGGPRFFASNNIAMDRALYLAMSGFDTGFPLAAGEDRAFCDAWRAAGHTMLSVPDAIVRHRHHLDSRSFWRQQFNYGRGAKNLHRTRRQHAAAEPTKPALLHGSFLTRLVRDPFQRLPAHRAVPCLLAMGLAQLAVTSGYLLDSSRQKP